jgi:membrane-associated phospholipid phosphatase
MKLLSSIQAIDKTVQHSLTGNSTQVSPKIDSILKWVPLATTLFTDAKSSHLQHKLVMRAKVIALAETIMNSILEPLKKLIPRQRPGNASRIDSFPSGHTATSFMGAEILRQATREKMPAVGYGGYALAIGTGLLRVRNKKHWLSDVVAGAVLGIVAAKIAHHIITRKDTRPEQ